VSPETLHFHIPTCCIMGIVVLIFKLDQFILKVLFSSLSCNSFHHLSIWELIWISPWRHRATPKVSWPETEKCILTKWLNPFFRIFCTITIQTPFWINLSMRFGLWWKMKKWEGKMCFFDHSFANIFFVFHFFVEPMLEFLENVTFFRIAFKSSNYNNHSRRKVLFSLHRKWWAKFSAAWGLSIVNQAGSIHFIRRLSSKTECSWWRKGAEKSKSSCF